MTSLIALAAAGLALLAAAVPAAAQDPMPHQATSTDSAAVAAVVHAFHAALERGDGEAAMALLAPDAVVLESGGVETREEYRSHHLGSDMEFARAVRARRSDPLVRTREGVAWASSTSVAEGEFRGRAVNVAGAELMVLVRMGDGWRIAAIHWSSRRRA